MPKLRTVAFYPDQDPPSIEIDLYDRRRYGRSSAAQVAAIVFLCGLTVTWLTYSVEFPWMLLAALPIVGAWWWAIYRMGRPRVDYRLRVLTEEVQIKKGEDFVWTRSWDEIAMEDPGLFVSPASDLLKLHSKNEKIILMMPLEAMTTWRACYRMLTPHGSPAPLTFRTTPRLLRILGSCSLGLAMASIGALAFMTWNAGAEMVLVLALCFFVIASLILFANAADIGRKLEKHILWHGHSAADMLQILPVMDFEYHVYRYPFPEEMKKRYKVCRNIRNLTVLVLIGAVISAVLFPIMLPHVLFLVFCYMGAYALVRRSMSILAGRDVQLEIDGRTLYLHEDGVRIPVRLVKQVGTQIVVASEKRTWRLDVARMIEETALIRARQQLELGEPPSRT